MSLYSVFIVKILCLISASGQIPIYYQFNVSNGLISNTVYDIRLDSDGFMWVATEGGLQRFDGNKFISFTYSENINRAGSCIQFDEKGRVWYQSFDGYLMYLEDNQVYQLTTLKAIDFTTFLIEDSVLICFTGRELVKLNINTFEILQKKVFYNTHITSIIRHEDSYFIAGSGLYKVSLDFKRLDTISNQQSIVSIFQSNDAFYYQFSSKSGYKIYKYSNNKVSIFYHSPIRINNLLYFDNKYYISSANGLTILDQNKEKKYFEQFKFSKIIVDNYNQMAISTLGKGVLIVPSEKDIEFFSTLSENFTYTLLSDDLLFLATESGNVFEFNVINKSLKTVYTDANSRYINKLFYCEKFDIFIIVLANEIKIFKNNEEIFSLINVAAKSVTLIDDKYFFITTTGGNGFIDFVMNQEHVSTWDSIFNALPVINRFKKAVVIQRNKDVVFNKKLNKILISTNDGVIVYDNHGHLVYPNGKLYIRKLFDFGHKIYGLDYNNNLYSFNENKLMFEPELTGIVNSEIKFVDSHKELFYTYNNKVFKYVNNRPTETDLISNHNIISLYDFDEYYIKVIENRLQVINKHSNAISYPKKLFVNAINDELVQNNNNVEVKIRNDNPIKIVYTFLNLDKRSKSELLYRINNNQWLKTQPGSDYLIFPSLRPDSYTIDFGIKEFGKISVIETFYFTVTTPIYKKTWFLIIVQLIVLFVIIFYLYWQVNLLIKKNTLVTEKAQIEKNLALMTLKSIKAQMNPHFFFNALNTIQAFIYSNDKTSATQYLSKFSKLTRQILENSDEELISLDKELKTIQLYLELEKMRFVNNFEFTINVSSDLDIENISIPTMLIQPYVENAIKHGLLHKKGMKILTVNVHNHLENQAEIEIIDNGIGLKKSQEINKKKLFTHKSFSSNANSKRIDLLNKIRGDNYKILIEELFDDQAMSLGTRVRIQIPII